jgi:NADH-quinone oxidoreductase subunit N
MLAYSAIAHAGYMLMAIVALNEFSASSILFYAAAYSLATLGAFTLLHSVSMQGNEQVSALKGFYSARPFTTLMVVILLLSLAGIPPVAGFFAKYYLFTGALQSNYVWLVIIAVISSLIGVFYYFRVLYTLFLAGSEPLPVSDSHKTAIILTAVLSLALGLFPSLLQSLI